MANVESIDGKQFEVVNPATGEVITHVPDMGQQEATTAVLAAHDAFLEWKKTTAKHRAGLLRKWFDLIVENADSLAKLLTSEQGKPYKEAYGEVMYGAHFLSGLARKRSESMAILFHLRTLIHAT